MSIQGKDEQGVDLPPADGWAAYWELERPDVDPFTEQDGCLCWQWKRRRIRVQAWGPNAFRIQITADSSFTSLPHMTREECNGEAPVTDRTGMHVEEITGAGAVSEVWRF